MIKNLIGKLKKQNWTFTFIGTDDPTTRRMLEGILAVEEEHADDMNSLLEQLGKKGEPARPRPAKHAKGK